MSEPHTHYFEVEMKISGLTDDNSSISMAAWTPGSYMIREYARHVERFQAKGGDGKDLSWKKQKKNTWQVQHLGVSEITLSYYVYAFEQSVRTSLLDQHHGFVHSASIFMFREGSMAAPITVEVHPFTEWKQISTGLKKIADDPAVFEADNYDHL